MYKDTTASLRTSDDGMSDFFDIKAGLLQGDRLAPFVFVWVVDYILKKAAEETGIGYTLVKGGQKGRIDQC